jgi:hypothetical protein
MYRHRPCRLGGPIAPQAAKKSRSRQPPAADSSIRWDLVRRVRRAIAAGTYETPEKWQAALDRLAQRLHDDP